LTRINTLNILTHRIHAPDFNPRTRDQKLFLLIRLYRELLRALVVIFVNRIIISL
jgi:hypothetical protein